MRAFLLILFLLGVMTSSGQYPPVVQWQKTYGGTDHDFLSKILPTPDGGFIAVGNTLSTNGDVTVNVGYRDAWVVKYDALGIIQWQKTYGGGFNDGVSGICLTSDGGYMLAIRTNSIDGDITNPHGANDVLLMKITVSGAIQWKKTYGGSLDDWPFDVFQTSDGGYIFSAQVRSSDGDIVGAHGFDDGWVVKVSSTGTIQWQQCFGSTNPDYNLFVREMTGGYAIAMTAGGSNGNIGCNVTGQQDAWFALLNTSGAVQFQTCLGGIYGDVINDMIQAADGGYALCGYTFSTNLPGYHNSPTNVLNGPGDVWVVKLTATGALQWQKCFGGSYSDRGHYIRQLADGGYVIAGSSVSADEDVCGNKGEEDAWIFKISAAGNIQWQKTYGGSMRDETMGVFPTPDGGYITGGFTFSNDGDVTGNHGGADFWVVKLAFPGVPIYPTVSIAASHTVVCPGRPVQFIATTTNGGAHPVFEWMVNGVVVPVANNDTVTIPGLAHNDIITCHLVSSSTCVADKNALSNAITIRTDASLNPSGFLPKDTLLCPEAFFTLKANTSFNSFLWNTGSTEESIVVDQPGTYWLQVVDANFCKGRDTIVVNAKACPLGFYIPTAFTPGGDGLNDVFRPLIFGNVVDYSFAVYNRWGGMVFRSNKPNEGWTGNIRSTEQKEVFVWRCRYQLAGKPVEYRKGTVVLIR